MGNTRPHQVWRVENDDGCGAFSGSLSVFSLDTAAVEAGISDPYHGLFHREDNGFPGPNNDPGFALRRQRGTLPDLHEVKFGCRSLSQLREWFPPAFDDLLTSHGYFVSHYEVDRGFAFFSQRQVMFVPECARLIQSEPIPEGFQ